MKRMLLWTAIATLLVTAASARQTQPSQPPAPPSRGEQQPAYRTIEIGRLVRDRDYAEELLRSMDSSALTGQGTSEGNLSFLAIYAAALAGAERADEAKTAIDRLLAGGPHEPLTYYPAWIAALRMLDAERLVAIVETAARNVSAEERGPLLPIFRADTVAALSSHLRAEGEQAAAERLDEALLVLGWPGVGDIDQRDQIRRGAIDRRLRRGEREEAARIAETIDSPAQLVSLMTLRRYDGLRSGDGMQRLRAAIDGADRLTRAAIEASPTDMSAALRRVQFLRSVGRAQEALAAAGPSLADVEANAVLYQGNWLLNEAAYAMLDLGRDDEAVALMSQLAAMDLRAYPELASQSINFTAVLRRAGRHQQALSHAIDLDRADPPVASTFGRMWLGSAIVCAHADLGRPQDAAAKLAWMREHEAENPAALERAYLCLGDMAAAEALMVRRLEAPETAPGAVGAFQEFELTPARERDDPLARRLRALRERPAVRAALDRVGRVLRLPLAETYWGNF